VLLVLALRHKGEQGFNEVHVTGVQGTRIDLVMAFCSRPSEGNVKAAEMNSSWQSRRRSLSTGVTNSFEMNHVQAHIVFRATFTRTEDGQSAGLGKYNANVIAGKAFASGSTSVELVDMQQTTD